MSGEEGVENVTGFIERDSNGVTREVANIACYIEVLASALEVFLSEQNINQ